jgi:hypothetical protein
MQCMLCCGYGLFKEGGTIEEGYCFIWKNNSHPGNSCALREKIQVSVARECFDAFVQEASCPQPHCSIRRRFDDTVHTLVLLPMNTTKTDIYEYVNSKV